MKNILLDRLNVFLNKYRNMIEINKSLQKVINEYLLKFIEPGDRVAIWGAGEHTYNLLKFINMEDNNIICFIDKSNEKINTNINGRLIISPNNIENYNIDTIIISSYEYRNEIREEIQEYNPKIKIIDFYDKYNFGYPIFNDLLNINFDMYVSAIISIYYLIKTNEYDLDKKIEHEILNIIERNRINTSYYESLNIGLDEKFINDNHQEDAKNKIKVDFFIQFPQGWTSLETVWRAFREDDKFITRIVQVPFIHRNRDNLKDEITNFLISNGIPFLPWYLYDINIEKPDIVFYQNPYDSSRPYEFSTKEVIKKANIAYVPYSLEIAGGVNTKMQFDLFLQNNVWLVFARSRRHKDMFKKYSSNKGRNVKVVGHPKIDCIYNLSSFDIDENMIKVTGGRKTLFWNPHFGVKGDISWSTFNKWKDIMLDIFEKRKDIFLIIRPHPLLLESIEIENEEDIPGIVQWKNRIKKMNNVYFDTNFDYRHSFAISDALISDASSFLLEYLPTYKPIMYLPNYEGPGLNDDGDIVDSYYIGNEREDIEKFVDMVSKGLDPMKDARISKIEEYLYVFDGKVGERIKEVVYKKYITETKQKSVKGELYG